MPFWFELYWCRLVKERRTCEAQERRARLLTRRFSALFMTTNLQPERSSSYSHTSNRKHMHKSDQHTHTRAHARTASAFENVQVIMHLFIFWQSEKTPCTQVGEETAEQED